MHHTHRPSIGARISDIAQIEYVRIIWPPRYNSIGIPWNISP